ncbi:MAG: toll/interleukin-1 receptor domain-containing protein [Chloroflexi bacterium]|nr:toll/interleukin-1 receptor domain-containing protein [Chloroflexota bacterium]
MVPAGGDVRVTLTIAQSNKQAALDLLRQHLALFQEVLISDPAVPLYPDLSIFISYRRDDSGDIVGRMYDRLAQTFGETSIFWDIQNMPDALDFRDVLRREVSNCDLLLVVMGKAWDRKKFRDRLNGGDDYVRLEIETAIEHNIPIIPVWVQRRQKMPSARALPPSLHPLVYRTARQVRPDPDFHTDMDDLIRRIKAVLGLDAPAF